MYGDISLEYTKDPIKLYDAGVSDITYREMAVLIAAPTYISAHI